MTSASVLFYGRRSRSTRTFDDLLDSSPSSSSDSCTRHRRPDLHRRHRHHHHQHHQHHRDHLDVADNFRRPSHPCSRPPLSGSEPHQQGSGSASRNVSNRETVGGLTRRFGGSDRLPGAVLLAKERLLQRLRGVTVQESRHNGESSSSDQCNDFWLVDADWETSGTLMQSFPNNSTELLPGALVESATREPIKKAIGLTRETFSNLNHVTFLAHQNSTGCLTSKSSNECSICLETFLEGNKLISLDCGHLFHTSCLYPWLRTSGECPYCRSSIVASL